MFTIYVTQLRGVLVVAATNRLDLLDPALLRSGRFDKLIPVPLPDEKARAQIFKVHTKKMPLADDVNLQTYAQLTEGLSGADIESLCREAAMYALRENVWKFACLSLQVFR